MAKGSMLAQLNREKKKREVVVLHLARGALDGSPGKLSLALGIDGGVLLSRLRRHRLKLDGAVNHLQRTSKRHREHAKVARTSKRHREQKDRAQAAGKRVVGRKMRKRTLSPAQLAALAKGRAAMAARRAGKKPRKIAARPAIPDKKLTVRPKRGNLRSMAKRRKGRRSSGSRAMVHGAPKSRARHALRAVGGIASQEKHRTGAFIVAAGLGLAKKQGYTIPHLETVGEAGSIALGAYAARKILKINSPWLDHAITAAGCIAIFDAVSTGNIPGMSSGKKSKTEGDDDVDGAYTT